jgi:hypothetical protein
MAAKQESNFKLIQILSLLGNLCMACRKDNKSMLLAM